MEETVVAPTPAKALPVCIICSKTTDSGEGGVNGGDRGNGDDKAGTEGEEMVKGLSGSDNVAGEQVCKVRDGGDIVRFLKEVLLLEGGGEGEGSKVKESDLEVVKKLPVCGECLEVIKAAGEKKIEADEVEKRVKELQAQVLEEMRRLEVQLKEYYVEMRRIGEIMGRADLGKMEGALKMWKDGGEQMSVEGLESQSGNGTGEIQPSLVESSDVRDIEKKTEDELQVPEEVASGNVETSNVNSVVGSVFEKGAEEDRNYFSVVNNLRESILLVIQEMDDKMNGDGGVDKRRKSRRLKKKAKRKYFDSSGVLDSITPLLHCAVKMEGVGEGAGIRRNLTSHMCIPEFNMETLIKLEPMDEDAVPKEAEDPGGATVSELGGDAPPPGVLQEDDDFEPEVISEVIVSGGEGHRGRPYRRRKASRKNNGEAFSENEEGLDDEDELLEDTSDDDFHLDEGEDDLGSESESSSEEEASSDDQEWDDGEEYGRKERKRKSKDKGDKGKRERKADPNSKSSRKSAYSKILDSINFSAMSKLKRKLIQRVLHKKYRRPTRKPKTPGKEDVADPRLEHFIEYDSLHDTFSLDGITINVIEEKADDGDDILILECSACNWQARPAAYSRHPVDSFIYNHIAGQHLNLFQCVQCGSNLGGFKQYSDHVLGHRMGFACDVCGRPLGGAQALARHKWSHLNDQEAAELIAKGLKDPREKKESTKIYPCATCGKIFPQRCQLKKHEKVHSSVRERITCEICGKQFLPSGFISHKRYYCFPEGVDHPRISCPLCPKVFKNKQFMQVHMDRAHNTERNHKCAQCGKGFKTKKDLMTHEETHTTERAFSCKKGCGRSYKTRKNCNAHEKRCDGRGGVLIQRFLDAGEDRPFSCRKGCGRAYKTRRTLRGHEKTCNGNPFVGEFPVVGGTGGGGGVMGGEGQQQITTMTVLGAALQSSMEAVMGGVIQTTTTTIAESVPEAVVTETVVTLSKNEFN